MLAWEFWRFWDLIEIQQNMIEFVFAITAPYIIYMMKEWCHYAPYGKLYKWNMCYLFAKLANIALTF